MSPGPRRRGFSSASSARRPYSRSTPPPTSSRSCFSPSSSRGCAQFPPKPTCPGCWRACATCGAIGCSERSPSRKPEARWRFRASASLCPCSRSPGTTTMRGSPARSSRPGDSAPWRGASSPTGSSPASIRCAWVRPHGSPTRLPLWLLVTDMPAAVVFLPLVAAGVGNGMRNPPLATVRLLRVPVALRPKTSTASATIATIGGGCRPRRRRRRPARARALGGVRPHRSGRDDECGCLCSCGRARARAWAGPRLRPLAFRCGRAVLRAGARALAGES